MAALARKFHEKKARKSGPLSVGDTPSLTPGSLERHDISQQQSCCAPILISHHSASLTTWTTQLSTLEKRAAEHDRYSFELQLQIADPLKNIAIRYEEIRKHHAEYATKLEKEKDAAFGMVEILNLSAGY